MEKRIAGEVIGRFENAGFTIVAAKIMQLDGTILREHYKMIQLDETLLNEHYAHVADLPFFPDIEAFMSSLPVMPIVLSGDGAIAKVRELLGLTNSKEAPVGTIRGDLGTDMMRNVVHASDSAESAAVEKKRFFPELY